MINSFTRKLSIHVVKHISYINNYLKARRAKSLAGTGRSASAFGSFVEMNPKKDA